MLKLVEDADAFDVIELMRTREFPPVPNLEWEGSALNVEIVAAILLGRGSRKPADTPRMDTRPHEAISELHSRAQRLGRLAIYRQQFEGRISDDLLAPLAAEYQVRSSTSETCSTTPSARPTRASCSTTPSSLAHGRAPRHTYPDVVTVRKSMHKLGGYRMTKLRDDTGAIVMQHHGIGQIPEEAMRSS